MQEQNFEKQVREKMDELSFVPSAPVWGKVEEQIRKKKEKRRIIFWLFPLLIISGAGWWLIAENNFALLNNPQQTSIQKSNQKQPDATKGKEPYVREHAEDTERTGAVTKITEPFRANTKAYLADKETKIKKTSVLPQYRITTTAIKDTPQSVNSTTIEQQEDKKVIVPVFNTIFYGFNADSVSRSRTLNERELTVQLKDTSPKNESAQQSKWQIAISIKGGKSGISESFGSLGNSSADMLYYASPATSAGNGFGNAAMLPPATPKAGAAFSAGFDVKRKIKSRFALVSGLHYAYYSNSIKVGSTVHRDTNIYRLDASMFRTEAFYRNDAYKKNYTNHYHYLQLPISAEYKLIKRLPLYVQAGIKIEQLLSTNALFYNQQAGVFVEDKEMLVKTGVQLFSGFSYQFRQQKAFSFAIGPQIQYGLTNLSKNKNSSQHLYFVGLSTQVFLKK